MLMKNLSSCVTLFTGLLLAALAQANDAGLPPGVRLALDGARIPAEAVAVWTQRGGPAPPPRSRSTLPTPMNPASVMKLVTAFAALERLGPAHTWSTRVASDGAPRERGARRQPLPRRWRRPGAGLRPPVEDAAPPACARRRAGRRATSSLDGSTLRLPPHDPDAFDGRGLRPYNSGPHGLLLHYNTLLLGLHPGKTANAPVTLAAEPPLAGLVIDNRILTSDAPCGTWYRDLQATLEPGRRLVLSGSLPAACGPRTWSAAPLPPAEFGSALVAALWSEVGGRLGGTVRDGRTPGGAEELLHGTTPTRSPTWCAT